MNHIDESYNEFFQSGFSLVIRSMRLSDSVEQDLELGRIATKALAIGLDRDWIVEMLANNREDLVQETINRRCH